MFSLTVSLRKKCFSPKYETLPRIYIFPRTLFKDPTSIYRKELQPDLFLPIRVNRSPACTNILYSPVFMSK